MLEFKGVTKQYLYGTKVLGSLDMTINDNEVVAILGDEGSGKTTFIKVASAVESYDGNILLDGKEVDTRTDDTMVVFDDLALFEGKSVLYNLTYPLAIRKYDPVEINRRVDEAAEKLDIRALLNLKVKKLSLFEKKKVALARLYLRDVKVVYIDDITSGLSKEDEKKLWDIATSILKYLTNKGTTIIFSTSSKEEAISISDSIVVMHYGEIKQIGTLDEIINNPSSIWAAEAIDENYHFEKGKLLEDDGLKLVLGDVVLDLAPIKDKIVKEFVGKDVYAGWREEDYDDNKLREDDVIKSIRKEDYYLLYTKDCVVKSKENKRIVSTLPKVEKVTLFDFLSEMSIMKWLF